MQWETQDFMKKTCFFPAKSLSFTKVKCRLLQQDITSLVIASVLQPPSCSWKSSCLSMSGINGSKAGSALRTGSLLVLGLLGLLLSATDPAFAEMLTVVCKETMLEL